MKGYDIVETVEWSEEWYTKIDSCGGLHFHWPDDVDIEPPLSHSPEYMARVMEARDEVVG